MYLDISLAYGIVGLEVIPPLGSGCITLTGCLVRGACSTVLPLERRSGTTSFFV